MAVTHPNPVTVDNAYNANWTTARPYVEDDVQALAANQNKLNDASQEVDAGVTALTERLDALTFDLSVARGLTLAQTSASPDTDIAITADSIVMDDGVTVISSVDVTLDVADVGAGGLDANYTLTADTWLAVFVIYNPTTETGKAFASEVTAPTLPSGYTSKRHVGWVRIDSDSDIMSFSYAAGKYTLFDDRTSAADVLGYKDASAFGATWEACSMASAIPSGVSAVELGFIGTPASGTGLLYAVPTTYQASTAGPQNKVVSSTIETSARFSMALDSNGEFKLRRSAIVAWDASSFLFLSGFYFTP